MNLEEHMQETRSALKGTGEYLLQVKEDLIRNTGEFADQKDEEDRGEEIANVTLAYRHLEDCIMRLGKVIQAYNGGKNPNIK